jgi:CRP/FNR family cyclic AMP-dependent transcriptional regulator
MRGFSQDAKVKALKKAPLFEGLSKKELTQLARNSEDVEVDAGKVLVKEGAVGQEFFVIVDGKVKITRKGRTLATRGAGDFVGEIALLEDTRRTATVTADTPVRFFVLTRGAFHKLLDDNPGVERKVLSALGRRLMELSKDPTLA